MNQDNLSDTSITMVRKFRTTVQRLYAAWTEPENIIQWMGPKEVNAVAAELDLREDGLYWVELQGEKNSHVIEGRYIEIIPNRKLKFTWKWRDGDSPETLVTLHFEEQEGFAVLTLQHENFASKEAAQAHNYGHSGGLDKLERLLSQA